MSSASTLVMFVGTWCDEGRRFEGIDWMAWERVGGSVYWPGPVNCILSHRAAEPQRNSHFLGECVDGCGAGAGSRDWMSHAETRRRGELPVLNAESRFAMMGKAVA